MMILTMIGTSPYPFDRLLTALDEYSASTGTRIVAQSGHTPPPKHLECHPFVSHDTLLQWIDEADVVVTQGGFGSLRDALARGARVVAVPRYSSFKEAMHDQDELVAAFAAEGLLVPVYDVKDLPEAIDQALGRPRQTLKPSTLPLHVAGTIAALCGHR